MNYIKCKGRIYVKTNILLNDEEFLYHEYKQGTKKLYTLSALKGYIECEKPASQNHYTIQTCELFDDFQQDEIIVFDEFVDEYHHDYKYSLRFEGKSKLFGLDDFVIKISVEKPNCIQQSKNISYNEFCTYKIFKVLGKNKTGKYVIRPAKPRIISNRIKVITVTI